MAPRRARHSGNRPKFRAGPRDFCCSGSAWMTECQSRWLHDKHPREEENTVAGKTSVTSQRILAIGTVLLAGLAWSLTFIATVNGQSPPGTLSGAASQGTSSQGTWTMKAPLPAPRAEVAAVAFDGKLHALGGSVSGTAGPYHDEYDPATDSWRARAPLPEGRDHLGVAVAAAKSTPSAASSARCIRAPAPAPSNTIRKPTLGACCRR